MNKADKFKLLYVLGISLIFFFTGCVDTSVQNIATSFDFHSQVKIVNLSSDAGTATFNVFDVKNSKIASASIGVGAEYPGNGQNFLDLKSGSKTFVVSYSSAKTDTFKLVMDSQLKMRFFLIDNGDGSRSLIKSVERYTWQAKGTANGDTLYPDNIASLSFFNGLTGSSITKLKVSGTQDTVIDLSSSPIGLSGGTNYMMLKAPAQDQIDFMTSNYDGSADSTIASVTFNPQKKNRYSAVLYGKSGAVQAKVYADDF